jgi:hypothetical protein
MIKDDTQRVHPPRGCSFVPQRVIAKLCENVGHKTPEALNERFGISYNTWRKLIAGQPVRTSVLMRLEQRLGLGGDDHHSR